ITEAIAKAGEETGEFGEEKAGQLAEVVTESRDEISELTVETVQDYEESELLDSEYKETAKAYIIDQQMRNGDRKPDIIKRRLNLKPYEYPELIEYKEAIQHSYWLHTEFNYTSDVQDFRINVSDAERNAIKNAMLAIAQVEVAVKNFWGDLHNRLPKPE